MDLRFFTRAISLKNGEELPNQPKVKGSYALPKPEQFYLNTMA